MKIYPKQLFNFLKISGNIIGTWPLQKEATKKDIFLHELKWWIAFLNTASILVPLLLAMYFFRDDSLAVTKALSELTALFEFFVNLIEFRSKKNIFQVIMREIEEFVYNSSEKEEIILQKYINRYKKLQIFVGMSFVTTAISFSCLPILTSQDLPADAWYPFSTKLYWIRTLLYSSHVLVIFQSGLAVTVDFTIAMMFWYSTMQIELLEKRVTDATSNEQLKQCVKRHQEIIILTDNINKGVAFIIFKTNATMFIVIVTGAFQLIHHEPIEVLLRFLLMTIAGCMKLYVTAKPADDLKAKSEHIIQIVCRAAIAQTTPEAATTALIFAFRCNKPIILTIPVIIKGYTLQYYASFLSSSVTYFVNLRAVLDD